MKKLNGETRPMRYRYGNISEMTNEGDFSEGNGFRFYRKDKSRVIDCKLNSRIVFSHRS